MRIRITVLLALALGGLTAIAVATVLYVLAAANIRNTLELNRNRAQLTISAVEKSVADHLAPARNLLMDMRRRVDLDPGIVKDLDRQADLLSGMLGPAPQLAGVGMWDNAGRGLVVLRDSRGSISVTRLPAKADAQLDAYASAAADRREMHWSRPFFFDGRTFITIQTQLLKNGAPIAVLVTGISLEELSRFLRTLSKEEITAFILYGDDTVLAHPLSADSTQSRLLSPSKPLLSVAELGDPALARFPDLRHIDEFGWEEFDIREFEEGDTTRLLLSRTSHAFGDVPWRIGVHISAEAVGEQLRRLVESILISVGLLAASLLLAIVLAAAIARPIRAVSIAASKIEKLDLASIRPLRRSLIREVDEQARSFNSMMQGLRWFETYAPRQLVRRLMSVSGQPTTDARAMVLTVMFVDIVGFTSLSERMSAADVAAMLNHNFEFLNSAIDAENGTVDKYIGDALMAFWGAPEPTADHAVRACRAALAIAAGLSDAMRGTAIPPLRLKIALHTGPLIVGNIGAPSRLNYTVVGDTVNVCARIESLASKFLGGNAVTIIASDEVVRATDGGFCFDSLGRHALRGRSKAVALYRLVSCAR